MIETVDGSALYVHSAEHVNQMCTKSHFFPCRLGCRGPAGGRSIARRAGNGWLLFQQPGLQRGANRRRKLVLCRQPGVDGAIALVNSRQRGGEIGLFYRQNIRQALAPLGSEVVAEQLQHPGLHLRQHAVGKEILLHHRFAVAADGEQR